MLASLLFQEVAQGRKLCLANSIVTLGLHLKVIMSREALNMALVAEQTEKY